MGSSSNDGPYIHIYLVKVSIEYIPSRLRGYPRQEYIPSRRVLVRACWIHTAAGDQNKALTAAEELSRNVEAELDAQESLDRCELAHSDARAGQG
jgi:hypothetical protein